MATSVDGMRWTGAAIMAFRRARGWTQEDLAQHVGVRVSTVSRWENQHQHPTRMAVRMLDMLATKQEVG